MIRTAAKSHPLIPAMLLGAALVMGSLGAARPALAQGPESVADLAQGLLGAVVNISTSQNVKEEGDGPVQQVPEGSPFQELFEDFFKNRGDGSGNNKVNSLGSGFVIDPAGFIVTNNHVIEGADDIEAIFPDGSKLKAKLIGTDPKTDLSVLKVEPQAPLLAVRFGDSHKMRIGDWVMAIGNPFGLGGTVTVGIISASGRNINAGPYDNFIQTDAAINKGNSGGPLFNMNGEVIGINTAIISPSGGSIGIGFAVPTELAENVIKQLIEFGETRRGWLGVRIQPVSEEVAESLKIGKARGALVSGLVKGGPVENGPIRVGDVIVRFDGKAVDDTRGLVRIVAESAVGTAVDVVVLRDGKEQTLKVKLGRLEDEQAADAASSDGEGAPDENMGSSDEGGEQQSPTEPGAPLPAIVGAIGIEIGSLDDAARKTYSIAESVEGVVITAVKPGSPAAEKGLEPGQVIVEVAQEFVETPADVGETLTTLKSEGRRNAYMMISDAEGNLRHVAIPLE
ncbi:MULTISPECIES: Do family serine endopeptidase [Alphaproteobacteria]|uniref:Serine protease n=2 Tax=Alphaproteobacteria TaxID=28211 RepID=A0ABQ6EEF5_9SPHN|nr:MULTISPECIES: Do family serine endopeptidase [Alphaproteobacteria]GEO86789.1 serine protease [Ciceribacter naphthalenivorans]GLR23369.1 serine protease [Ciceribacter naphthalenivorans]GLT06225.1 serine protease [Sphingomonas psychrolutea]